MYSERLRLAKHAGMKVMELLEKNICIKDIITEAAIHNAMECDMAFGGSTNTVLHLTAIAQEAGHPITMDDWDAAVRGDVAVQHAQGANLAERVVVRAAHFPVGRLRAVFKVLVHGAHDGECAAVE